MPKPLLTVGGRPLIEYHLEAFAAGGIREVVINLAWHGALIRERIGDGSRFGLDVAYSDEGEVALETGGGVLRALPLLGDAPFIVVSGDIWTQYGIHSNLPLARGDAAHFVLVPNPPYHPKGDFGLQGRRVVDAGQRYTYANIGIFRPEFFAACQPGRFALAPLMLECIRTGRASGELYTGRWFNIGTPAQLAQLDQLLRGASVP